MSKSQEGETPGRATLPEQQPVPGSTKDASSPGEALIPLPPEAETKLRELGADPQDPEFEAPFSLAHYTLVPFRRPACFAITTKPSPDLETGL
jgi:hypothetical protein